MKLFTHIPTPIPNCTLDESNKSHIYTTPSGIKLESVTKMVNLTKPEKDKENLKKWRREQGEGVADYIFQNSAVIGKEAHTLNEKYLRMIVESDTFTLLSHAHHQKFIPYLNKIDNIYGIERRLYSESMRLAGTADCIAEYNGKLSIIDYKTKRSTSKKEWITDYFIQTTAYAEMWKELTGQSIQQLVILVSSEKNTIQEFQSVPNIHTDELYTRVDIFNRMT